MAPIPSQIVPKVTHVISHGVNLLDSAFEKFAHKPPARSIILYIGCVLLVCTVLFGVQIIGRKLFRGSGSRLPREPRRIRHRNLLRPHAIGNSREYQRKVSAMPIEGEAEARLDFEPHLPPLYAYAQKVHAKRSARKKQSNSTISADDLLKKVSELSNKEKAKVRKDQEIHAGPSIEQAPRKFSTLNIRSYLSGSYDNLRRKISDEGEAQASKEPEIPPGPSSSTPFEQVDPPTRSIRSYLTGSCNGFPQRVPKMPIEGEEEAQIDWRDRLAPLFTYGKEIQAIRSASKHCFFKTKTASKKNSNEELASDQIPTSSENTQTEQSKPQGSGHSAHKGKRKSIIKQDSYDELSPLLDAEERRPSFPFIQSSNSRAERTPSEPAKRPHQYYVGKAAKEDLKRVTTAGKKVYGPEDERAVMGYFNTTGYRNINDQPYTWKSRRTGEEGGFWLESPDERDAGLYDLSIRPKGKVQILQATKGEPETVKDSAPQPCSPTINKELSDDKKDLTEISIPTPTIEVPEQQNNDKSETDAPEEHQAPTMKRTKPTKDTTPEVPSLADPKATKSSCSKIPVMKTPPPECTTSPPSSETPAKKTPPNNPTTPPRSSKTPVMKTPSPKRVTPPQFLYSKKVHKIDELVGVLAPNDTTPTKGDIARVATPAPFVSPTKATRAKTFPK